MTIEMSPAPCEAKPAASSETKNSKNKSSSEAKSDAGGPGGFTAILAAEDAPTPATTTSGALDDASSLTQGQQDPSLFLATPQFDLSGDKLLPDAPLDAAALLAQSLHWNPLPEGNEVPTVSLVPGGASSAVGRAGAATIASAQVPVDQLLTTGATSSTTRKTAKDAQDKSAGQVLLGAALPSSTGGMGQVDARTLQTAPKVEAMLVTPSAVESALATAAVSVKRDESGAERSIFKMSASESTAVPQPVVTGAPATNVLTTSAVVPPSDVYVAEQVKYWISNDVQNAEMTLDGIGANAVEVSITMQGNEAHVAFRTDEPQAREALENASLHLKEMLRGEGLILSGVSVGTAGAGDSGGQERRPRQGVRQAVVPFAQPISVGATPAGVRVSGRTLDLFV
jgi:flagellar hook-length control protein FliK